LYLLIFLLLECECNPQFTQTKIQKGQFLLPFFFVYTKIISDEEWWRIFRYVR